MDRAKRLKLAESLLITGGEGNVQLVAQDMKLLVRQLLGALEAAQGPEAPAGAVLEEASREASAITAQLEGLGRASAQEQFAALERVEAFVQRWGGGGGGASGE